jgi:hypothetical protein
MPERSDISCLRPHGHYDRQSGIYKHEIHTKLHENLRTGSKAEVRTATLTLTGYYQPKNRLITITKILLVQIPTMLNVAQKLRTVAEILVRNL